MTLLLIALIIFFIISGVQWASKRDLKKPNLDLQRKIYIKNSKILYDELDYIDNEGFAPFCIVHKNIANKYDVPRRMYDRAKYNIITGAEDPHFKRESNNAKEFEKILQQFIIIFYNKCSEIYSLHNNGSIQNNTETSLENFMGLFNKYFYGKMKQKYFEPYYTPENPCVLNYPLEKYVHGFLNGKPLEPHITTYIINEFNKKNIEDYFKDFFGDDEEIKIHPTLVKNLCNEFINEVLQLESMPKLQNDKIPKELNVKFQPIIWRVIMNQYIVESMKQMIIHEGMVAKELYEKHKIKITNTYNKDIEYQKQKEDTVVHKSKYPWIYK